MTITVPNYIEAIAEGFPTVQAVTFGDPYDYNTLFVETQDPPLPALPSKAALDAWILNRKKYLMAEVIKAERDSRKAGGVLAQGNWFHSDDASRIQQLGLKSKADTLIANGGTVNDYIQINGGNQPWKTMAGSYVYLTPSLVYSIFDGIGVLDNTVFSVCEYHLWMMYNSATPETYNYSGNWPARYIDTI